MNGDGRADVLIGATAADANRREDSGSAYVVFGRGAGKVDLRTLRSGGFRIDGAAEFDYAASSVAGAGDLNGDGRADVIVSAEQADQNGRDDSGSVYVVFGRRAASRIDLAKLGERGLRLDGAAADDLTGWSVSGVGDMNGDKQPDLLLGAQAASVPEREHSGTAYVAFLPDIAVPGLKVNSRSPQRVLRGSGVLVTASCSEACTLKASGSVDRPKLPLTPVTASLRAPGTRTMRLTLPPADAGAARRPPPRRHAGTGHGDGAGRRRGGEHEHAETNDLGRSLAACVRRGRGPAGSGSTCAGRARRAARSRRPPARRRR